MVHPVAAVWRQFVLIAKICRNERVFKTHHQHEFSKTYWQWFGWCVLLRRFAYDSYFICWFLNLSEWKILITPYYSKMFNTQIVSINTKPHKSLFSFSVLVFFSVFLLLDWISCFFVTWRHLFKIGKGALYSFFSSSTWVYGRLGSQFTINDFQSISDFLSISTIVFFFQ